MPLSKFVQASADRQESIESAVADKQKEISKRFQELLEKPGEISPFIISDFLNDGLQVMSLELGSSEMAQVYWDNVGELIQFPMSVLAETPYNERGSIWVDAASTLVAAAQIQAEIESGLTQDSAVIGIESGKELGALTKGIPNEQLKKATFNIKPELAKRKKERNGSNK